MVARRRRSPTLLVLGALGAVVTVGAAAACARGDAVVAAVPSSEVDLTRPPASRAPVGRADADGEGPGDASDASASASSSASVAEGDGDEPSNGATPPDASPFERAFASWAGPPLCASFDYFPNGGLQSFWCRRPASLSLAALHTAAGVAPFLSGPHAGDALTTTAPSTFGHYDPAFVRWLVASLAPVARGTAAQRRTQRFYDAYAKPLAEVFWATYAKSQRDRACFLAEKSRYEGLVARKALPAHYHERWFFFMNPFFCERVARGQTGDTFYYANGFDGGVSGNVTKTAVGFWIRRTLDGTAASFADGLKKLLASYEPDLLTKPARGPDTAAIARALAASVAGAAACKDPAAPARESVVHVTFAPDGRVKQAQVAFVRVRGTPLAACIERVFAQATVPPFDGGDLRFDRTVALR